MQEIVPNDKCVGCSACANICPKQCIQMCPDTEGFLYPLIEQSRCINCGLCVKSCPVIVNPLMPEVEMTKAYAAISKNEPIRLESSSGGFFSVLSEWVFEHDGIVFGAAYAEDFSVVHCAATNMEDMRKLRTSKYSQSVIGDTFQQVRKFLREDKYVLFSGTPCQVAGLQSYLKKPYERLILVDMICHGVPSPRVWENYLTYRKNKDAPFSEIRAINLRDKKTGWPDYSILFEYMDGTIYSLKGNQDPFLRGFLHDFYLRPSCYECSFKGIARQSDFTLADYWGIERQFPEYYDGKGTSLLFLHSQKATNIWQEVESGLFYKEVNPEDAIKENPSAIRATQKPNNRSEFWQLYPDKDFDDLIEELIPKPVAPKCVLIKRGISKIKRILKNL